MATVRPYRLAMGLADLPHSDPLDVIVMCGEAAAKMGVGTGGVQGL
jgi:hypothetical protein